MLLCFLSCDLGCCCCCGVDNDVLEVLRKGRADHFFIHVVVLEVSNKSCKSSFVVLVVVVVAVGEILQVI